MKTTGENDAHMHIEQKVYTQKYVYSMVANGYAMLTPKTMSRWQTDAKQIKF